MDSDSTLMNALVGGLVAVVLSSFLGPFSSIVGGAAAGYLQRGDLRDGLRVGVLAGALAVVPMLLFGFVMIGFVLSFLGLGHGFASMSAMAGNFLLLVVTVTIVTSVALSALGGVVGVYLESELDV